MRVSYFCFVFASIAALVGMSLGMGMGMSEDFTLAPVHAHLNLLGWVTMALYGLYHRGVDRRSNRLAWGQVGCGSVGAALMAGGLAVYIPAHDPALVVPVIIGSMFSLASMAMFLVIVLLDLRRSKRRPEAPADDNAVQGMLRAALLHPGL